MQERLVVGFDGSESALTAMRWAAAEADGRQASVRVVGSYAMPPIMEYYGISSSDATPAAKEQLAQACRSGVTKAIDACRDVHPNVGFDFKIVDDQPVDALVHEAQDADLVVVGSSGLGPVSSVLLGSVTAGVLQRSPCPVVVTPLELRAPTGRVVVGYDGSDVAGRALDWAAEQAGRLGAELVVAHAWKYPHRLTRDGSERSCDIARLDAALVLEEGVRRARERTSAKVVQELVEGGAAQAMLSTLR